MNIIITLLLILFLILSLLFLSVFMFALFALILMEEDCGGAWRSEIYTATLTLLRMGWKEVAKRLTNIFLFIFFFFFLQLLEM